VTDRVNRHGETFKQKNSTNYSVVWFYDGSQPRLKTIYQTIIVPIQPIEKSVYLLNTHCTL